MTEIKRDQLQATAEQVATKFQDFFTALPEDERQLLALAIASAPYGADGVDDGAGMPDDVRGFADNNPAGKFLVENVVKPVIQYVVIGGVVAGAGAVWDWMTAGPRTPRPPGDNVH